jgi:hypothetical protein
MGLSNGRTVFSVRYELYLYVWPTTIFYFAGFEHDRSWMAPKEKMLASTTQLVSHTHKHSAIPIQTRAGFGVCLRNSKEQSLRTVACLKIRIVMRTILYIEREKAALSPPHTHSVCIYHNGNLNAIYFKMSCCSYPVKSAYSSTKWSKGAENLDL